MNFIATTTVIRVISEDTDLSRARLLLIENVQKTVRCGLEILGVKRL